MFKRKFASSAAIVALIVTPILVSFPSDGWAQVSNIVVTTRKREENLQDIPLSVTAISSVQIEQRGITNVGDAIKFTPGVEWDRGYGGQDTRVVIRGMAPTRGRPNAAFMVDGVDYTGEAVSTAGGGFAVNQRLIDIERIEVVKGPQSALYGRSAFAGAIRYITKNPNMEEFEAEGGFDVSRGENGGPRGQVSAAAGGPVTDTFGLRVNSMWYDEDGFYANTISEDGERIGGSEGWGVATKALWEPTDSLSFMARAAFSRDDYEMGAQARVSSNTVGTLPPSLVRASFLGNGPDCTTAKTATRDQAITSCANLPRPMFIGTVPDGNTLTIANATNPRTNNDYPGTQLETTNVTLVSEWDSDFGSFTSITGYAHSDSEQLFEGNWDAQPPGTYTSLDGVARVYTLADCGLKNCSPAHQEVDFINETTLWSQEVRWASDFDGPLNFTVGGLYWNEDVKQNEGGLTISPAIFGRGNLRYPPPFVTKIENFPIGSQLLLTASRPNRTYNNRETEHWSSYIMAEWEITNQFKATFEGRYVDESLTRVGPQCDVAATLALTGLAGVDIGTDTNGDGEITGSETSVLDGIADACHTDFRGASSTSESVTGGSLAVGTLTGAVTKDLTASVDESFFTPKLTLEWSPTDDQLWYFSVAHAIKPGGISTILAGNFFTPSTKSFDKEKLMVYEIGSKTAWLDGTLLINGTGYYQKYTDKQTDVTQLNPVTDVDVSGIENAGAAEIFGVEFDALWQPDDHWAITAGYSYIDAEYTDFKTTTGSRTEVIANILNGNGGCVSIVDDVPGLDPDGNGPLLGTGATAQDNNTDLCVIDNSGNAIEDIAKHSFVGSIQYTRPLASTGMDWFIQANAVYSSKRYANPDNLVILDSYWTADLRAGLSSESWDLILYVDNLFDDDTVKSVLGSGSQIETVRQSLFPPGPSGNVVAFLPDPRVIGVRGLLRL